MIPGVLKLGYTLESLGEAFSIQKSGHALDDLNQDRWER